MLFRNLDCSQSVDNQITKGRISGELLDDVYVCLRLFLICFLFDILGYVKAVVLVSAELLA